MCVRLALLYVCICVCERVNNRKMEKWTERVESERHNVCFKEDNVQPPKSVSVCYSTTLIPEGERSF